MSDSDDFATSQPDSTNTCIGLDFPPLRNIASTATKVPQATPAQMVVKRPAYALPKDPSPVCRTSQAVVDAKIAKERLLQVGASANDATISRHMSLWDTLIGIWCSNGILGGIPV